MRTFILLLLLSLTVKGQELSLLPKTDKVYHYENEIISHEIYGGVDFASRLEYDAQFLSKNELEITPVRFRANTTDTIIDSNKGYNDNSFQSEKTLSKLNSFQYVRADNHFKYGSKSDKQDRTEKIIKEVIEANNPIYNSLYENLVLRKGHSWKQTDSIVVDFNRLRKMEIDFNFNVNDITAKEVVVKGNGTITNGNITTDLAVKYVLDRKTGIPLYTKFIAVAKYANDILMISKLTDYEAPSLHEEFFGIKPYFAMQDRGGQPLKPHFFDYMYKEIPSLVDANEDLSNMVENYINNFSIYEDEQVGFYYLSVSHGATEKEMLPITAGGKIKINNITYFNKKGNVVDLTSCNLPDSAALFGFYHYNFYEKKPEVYKTSMDVTVWKPQKRKKIEVTSNTENSKYKIWFNKDTVFLEVRKPDLDGYSFKFYNSKGEEIAAKYSQYFFDQETKVNGESVATRFIDQNMFKKEEFLYRFKFSAEDVSKVTFNVCTSYKKFRFKNIISNLACE
ncbi:hypothetical protein [Galbibacter mesophilus]|uniref:hypothetical protein n=1 Tax=Galbibacter mesophilus TaxID=379069 RepID=UPI00191D234F|nr:hypothetical protein [Galbibacter mesophilus]MCM5662363.1 hypothetical protein [Galbibacter mesophilus]